MPPHAKHTMSHHQPGPLGGRKLGSEKQTAPYSVGSIIAQSARKAQRSASSSIPGHASALIVLHGTDHLHGASPISGYGSPPGSDHGSSYSAQSAAAAEQQPASPPAADSSSPGSRRSSVAYCRNVVFAGAYFGTRVRACAYVYVRFAATVHTRVRCPHAPPSYRLLPRFELITSSIRLV